MQIGRERTGNRYGTRTAAPQRERYDPQTTGRGRQSVPTPRRGGNWFLRHKAITVVFSVALLAAAVGIGIFLRITSDPGSLLVNRPDEGTAAPAAASANGTTQPQQQQEEVYTFPKDVVNILILGTDSSAERIRLGMNARTDCVMLASINTTTKAVSLISIPRDTYVRIYDEANGVVTRNRINAAFSFGGGLNKNGIAYAKNTVAQCLGGGIPIDHFVLFDMDLVKNLIDDVGGVTVDVNISVSVPSAGVSLKPGVQKLNGIQALTYARDRHNTKGGDIGRAGHQQQVMIALLKELQNKGNIVKKIPELYESLSGNVTTNGELGAMQIAALAWIAKDVSVADVKQYTLKGKSLTIDGASIVVSDQEEKQRIIREVFGIDYKIRQDETYDYLKGEITAMLNAGQGIIDDARSLLRNNMQYYTADEASGLKSAINAWQTASRKGDSDGMQDAQQDVQTEYAILKALIDKRKAEPKDTPAPENTPAPEDTPAPQDTETPVEESTPTPEPEQTDAPEPTPEPTDDPAPEQPGEQESPDSTAVLG